MMVNKTEWIPADWPTPDWVHAGTTTRLNGISQIPYASFNLSDHVGDNVHTVQANRQQLIKRYCLPTQPFWLKQIHGKTIMNLDTQSPTLIADGSTTTQSKIICAVMTADCLPLVLCNPEIPRISAIHIGWRGFCEGIIAEATSAFHGFEKNTLAWIGPCINKKNYIVREDMMKSCMNYSQDTMIAFRPKDDQHWFADLAKMVVIELKKRGINSIYGNDYCTFDNHELFYSYRRDGITGRMATLIWMEPY